MTPEARARVAIDHLPSAAGWYVCDMKDTNLPAARGVAIREFPLNPGHGEADDALCVDGKAAWVEYAKAIPAVTGRPRTQRRLYPLMKGDNGGPQKVPSDVVESWNRAFVMLEFSGA